MSEPGFIEIKDIEAFDRFISDTNGEPAIVFKHSNMCGISALAYREMKRLSRPIALVTVQKAREVSDEIERRFELPHETPQALVVKGNELIWHASHSRVSADAIEEAARSTTDAG